MKIQKVSQPLKKAAKKPVNLQRIVKEKGISLAEIEKMFEENHWLSYEEVEKELDKHLKSLQKQTRS